MVKRPNESVLIEALDVYRDAMRPFIVRAMRRIKGKGIEDAICDSLSRRRADEFERRLLKNGYNVEGAIDIGDFPHLIRGNWGHVFSQQFSGDMNIQDLLRYITRARNEVSHPDTEDLDADYTSVVLYHIIEVLDEINAPDARAKVKESRNKLLQPDDAKAERSTDKESDSKPRETTRQEGKIETPSRVPVSDRPEKYNTYFQALLDELREQHNFTRARRPVRSNYCKFASGFGHIEYVARFPNVGTVHTYLLLRFGDKQTTKNFFDVLKERESEINARFDVPLYWSRCDDIKTSRIYIERDGTIDANESELEAFRAWHVENLLKFKEVFTPEIQLAHEKLKSSDLEN